MVCRVPVSRIEAAWERCRGAASLRRRLTTVAPAVVARLRNSRLAYAPSATIHNGFSWRFSQFVNLSTISAASSSLVRNSQPYLARRIGRFFMRTYNRASKGRPMVPQFGCLSTHAIVTQT